MIFRHLPRAVRFMLVPDHDRRYRRWLETRRAAERQTVDSVVIPCYGADYVGEAVLSAWFARVSQPHAREIVVVTDQPVDAFGELPAGVRVVTVAVPKTPRAAYGAIWHSRLLKIGAPLQAAGPVIAIIDSDLMLLREFSVALPPNALLGSFRKGRMAAKLKGACREQIHLRGSRRPFLETHINSGFLVAHRATWEKLCPLWTQLFLLIWESLCDQPPTDQLPLAIALDRLGIVSGDLGILANWPVSKMIGGKTMPIPRDVIGAHGGFPLSEYEKLKADRDAPLSFRDDSYTRKARYQDRPA